VATGCYCDMLCGHSDSRSLCPHPGDSLVCMADPCITMSTPDPCTTTVVHGCVIRSSMQDMLHTVMRVVPATLPITVWHGTAMLLNG
jgi:hypothetical protein